MKVVDDDDENFPPRTIELTNIFRTTTCSDSDNEIAEKALTLLAGDEDGLGRAYIWNTFRLASEGQYYHGGGTFGTSAWISIYPRERLGIFLVTPYVSETAQEQLNITASTIIEKYRQK